jgi:glutamine synthetase
MSNLLEGKELEANLHASNVRYALASFVDLHGISKAKAVPLAHLGQMMARSELFTGAALDGVPQEMSDDEVSAVPDPASASVSRNTSWPGCSSMPQPSAP